MFGLKKYIAEKKLQDAFRIIYHKNERLVKI